MWKTLFWTFLLSIGLYSNGLTWEDEFPNSWLAIGKDSAELLHGGGFAIVSSSKVFETVHYVDSLCKLNKWRKCIMNLHIGNCDSQVVAKYRLFIEANEIRIGGVGCRESRSNIKIVQIGSSPGYVFNEKEFRMVFHEPNLDSNFIENKKKKIENSKREHEIWIKSPEGKASIDSLRKKYRNSKVVQKHLDSIQHAK